MSGETENSVSAWTIDSLRAHISELDAETDRRYEQRFMAQEKGVEAALAAAEKAVDKALAANDKRFESVNEFRATLQDQTNTFIPRAEYMAHHSGLEEKVATLISRVDKAEAAQAGSREYRTENRAEMSVTAQTITVVITLVLGVLAIVSFIAART